MKKMCKKCGSENIVFDSWSKWNSETESFELYDTFNGEDTVFCLDCNHKDKEANESD